MYNEGHKHIRESDMRLQLLCQQNHIKSILPNNFRILFYERDNIHYLTNCTKYNIIEGHF